MTLLGELGIVEGGVRRFEIGAAILLVGVEEERIQPSVEIVVVGDVVLRAAARIELSEMPDRVAQPPLQLGPARHHVGLIHQDRERVRDRAVLDDEGAFHVDFAERKFGVQKNPALGLGRQEPHRHRPAGSISAAEFCSACSGKVHRAAANELLQAITQQTVHRNHQTSAIPTRLTHRPSNSTHVWTEWPHMHFLNDRDEQGRALVRCTQSGYSGMSRSRGCVISALPFEG